MRKSLRDMKLVCLHVSQRENEGERRKASEGRLFALDEAKEAVSHARAPQLIVVTAKVEVSG
jgi:hypothetical protein